jgi:sodium transport system permease protein
MNSKIVTIMKKEFARFFGDKRMVMTTMILPGLMIYLVYTFMGQAMISALTVDESYQPIVYTLNLPDSIRAAAGAESLFPVEAEQKMSDTIMEDIREKNVDLFVVFPENFDEAVVRYDSRSGGTAPKVELYYNGVSKTSAAVYSRLVSLLDGYESSLANKFDVNPGETRYDLASDRDTAAYIIAMIVPLLILIFMYSSCMTLAAESIAGEKERGTIATLLVTPITCGELAAGKVLSLSIMAFLCGLSSVIGTMLAIPKMFNMGGPGMDNIINMGIYGPLDYGLLILVIYSTVLLMVTAISLISAWAKNIKEAQSLVMPLLIVIMLAGVIPMFGDGARPEWYYYLIPVYNSVQCLSGILTFDYRMGGIVTELVTNIVISGLGAVILSRMFNSEKVMFSK